MANNYFKFKQFTIYQEEAAFKVTTDSVLLGAWADIQNAGRIIDIGTGTGLLALMAAQRSNAVISAVEPDSRSFNQALSNIKASKWSSRISLFNCQVQDYTPEKGLLFDAIITNPPFFSQSLLNPDIRKANARHALTLTHEELISASMRLLAGTGILYLILPTEEGHIFIQKAGLKGLFCNRILKVKPAPSQNPERVLLAMSRCVTGIEDETIVIEQNGRHGYSEEYVALTRDFYLKM